MGEVTWDVIITKVAPISGFIGAIIALVVNTYFTNKGKKAGVRPYIEVVSLRADPNLDEGGFKKGAKMVVDEELKKHLDTSKEENEILDGLKWRPTFLKIKNISSNPCFGLRIKRTQQNSNAKEYFRDLEFYVLKGDDELYIPMKTINSLVYPKVIVEVEYTTIANERMIFRSEMTFKNEKEVEILQGIYVVKRWWKNEKIVQTTVSNVEWKDIK
ncbi:hypothetical protein ICG_01917 [Bacillus cereus BAG1X1-3]|uniref:hypothetical protein n=1 Tax=Bacillus mycoides TaxID=1405 RepID=UPI00027AA71F|nr:hypothetical protein [Bacillus mycoides]EJS58178.1 hypothetical protein ICG_01917 [Bacillus cereus BAG1X1-3]MBG9688791.1 hypothetical protein [Bacillus mycoides]